MSHNGFFAIKLRLVLALPLAVVVVSCSMQGLHPPTAATLSSAPLATSGDQPQVVSVIAMHSGNRTTTVIEIGGQNFDLPRASSFLRIDSADGLEFTINATDPALLLWDQDRIRVELGKSTIIEGTLSVITAEGASSSAPIAFYRYDGFSIPITPNTNAVPLAIAVDDAGRVWINQEFHRALQVWEPQTNAVRQIPIPVPSDPGLYGIIYLGQDLRTSTSEYGEDIQVDRDGRIWFTEGGTLYNGQYPNHSRIVRYDPNAPEGDRFRVYNIPGDNNQVVGLAFDLIRNRIWFTSSTHNDEVYIENGESIRVEGPIPSKLVSFDPDRVPYGDGTSLDYSRASKDLICAPDASDSNCYHEYSVPIFSPEFNTGIPGHVVVDQDGFVWYTAYWGGNYIGRLNPDDGIFERFPLPMPIGTHPLVRATPPFESGPWQIGIALNGDIVITESFDSTLSRLRVSALSNACQNLDSGGKNPCIDERIAPGISLSDQLLHSLAFDANGNVWFAQSSDDPDHVNPSNTIGYVDASWDHVALFPPLALISGDKFVGAGIAIGRNGDIWFVDYLGHRLGRFQKVN